MGNIPKRQARQKNAGLLNSVQRTLFVPEWKFKTPFSELHSKDFNVGAREVHKVSTDLSKKCWDRGRGPKEQKNQTGRTGKAEDVQPD